MNCSFRRTCMRVSKIGDAKFENCFFEECDMSYCSAEEASFTGSSFKKVKMEHMSLVKPMDELELSSISDNEMKNETSFETSLKQVLKQKDYKKLEPIIKWLAREEIVSIQEVMELTHKSRTTAWRYMQLLVECGAVEMVGNTNNVSYRKVQIK